MDTTPNEDPIDVPHPNVVEELVRWHQAHPKPELVTISAQVPISVTREIETLVYEAKMQGERLTKQDIITAALVKYLGLSS